MTLCACKEDRAPRAAPGLSNVAAPEEQPPPIGYDPRKMLLTSRDSAILPHKAVGLLALEQGMVVADIGAGPGYFTFRLARAVGRTGVVYALEIRSSILEMLRRRTADSKLNPFRNVLLVNNRVDDTNLEPGVLDVALLCEVHICLRKKTRPDEARMMASIFRTLKPGGVLGVLELKKNPKYPTYVPANIVQNLSRVGFVLERAEADYSKVAVFYRFRRPRSKP